MCREKSTQRASLGWIPPSVRILLETALSVRDIVRLGADFISVALAPDLDVLARHIVRGVRVDPAPPDRNVVPRRDTIGEDGRTRALNARRDQRVDQGCTIHIFIVDRWVFGVNMLSTKKCTRLISLLDWSRCETESVAHGWSVLLLADSVSRVRPPSLWRRGIGWIPGRNVGPRPRRTSV